jgi:IS4 transposase
LQSLNVKSLLCRCNIMKRNGYTTAALLYWLLLLPFIMKRLTFLWTGNNALKAGKDAYYRFLNNEYFNWRAFIYRLALKMIVICDDAPLKEKTLIIDDTIEKKTGKEMELVSYHFDHTTQRSILGYQCVQLGYHNGKQFFPLDVGFHVSRKRPNVTIKTIDKRSNGWKRRKEAFRKKTTVTIDMLKRAWSQGVVASFVLFDSWYAHDVLIADIMEIGYGVICRLKSGRVKYCYQGSQYTLKQLWQNVAKKKAKGIQGFAYKGICLKASLPKSGEISILFVSDGKKQWNAFLCTDMELEPSEILTYYARRWAIELFFKDGKQMLYLGKEQSETFDAVVASYSLVMIRYLLLVFILRKYQRTVPLGPLFRELAETHLQIVMMETMWCHIKDILILSSDLLLADIEPDIFLHFLDIVEDAILMQVEKATAKL